MFGLNPERTGSIDLKKGGGDNGREKRQLWVWLYWAKTKKHQKQNRRKKAQKIQVISDSSVDTRKGKGMSPLPLPSFC
jgi:hypothetical protein